MGWTTDLTGGREEAGMGAKKKRGASDSDESRFQVSRQMVEKKRFELSTPTLRT